MDIMDIINEIEIGNNYCQDGLDYEMDCVVTVNKVRTRCDQISVVQCDMTKKGKGIELLLELRRGDFITWIFIDDIVCKYRIHRKKLAIVIGNWTPNPSNTDTVTIAMAHMHSA